MKTIEKLLLEGIAVVGLVFMTAACDKSFEAPVPESLAEKEISDIIDEEDEEQPYVFPETRLSLSGDQIKNIDPGNDFTFKYFAREFNASNASEAPINLFSSPLSVQFVCGMIGNQVKDNKALCEMLGIDGDINDVNAYFEKLMGDVSSIGGTAKTTFANALMTDVHAKKFPDTFISSLNTHYKAEYLEIEAKPLEEQPQGERPEDLWVKEKTDGMIDVAPIPILPTFYSLFNVLCYKGAWVYKFDSKETEDYPFFIDDDTIVERPLMYRKGYYALYRGEKFSSVSLPMGDGSFNLTVLLPNEKVSLGEVINGLDSETWNEVREGYSFKKIRLRIPRFSVTYTERNVMDYLDKSFFDSYREQILEMINSNQEVNPFNSIIQKAVVRVNEDGTSAAVVTQGHLCLSAGPVSIDNTEAFVANHPFVFMISEAGSGLVLFVGTYMG